MYVDPNSVILAVGVGLFFLAVYFSFLLWWQKRRRARVLERVDFDRLDGVHFETFVADLLTRQGYRVKQTGRSGDLGVDLIAEKKRQRIAIQVKRQAQPVSRRAVSDAVAGKAQYGCNAAMVVTNNFFSAGAQELANSNGCKLVDRNVLADWLISRGD